ncbi:hypothetical protein SEA_MORKIE_64 [Gordonia phage Morkie]|nr:hypothetical protein SEA_MORKIE_64 [Gordonia phage Morkie]
MTDLMQIVQFGNQTGTDPIRWDNHDSRYLVPATNRRRILDREHANGITPGDDGWLTFGRDLGTLHGTHIWHWTRIRWETMPHLETQELP